MDAEPLDAVVIGAGFAGLYMVYRLREQGFSVHGFERGDGVGGTWYWNRYPGRAATRRSCSTRSRSCPTWSRSGRSPSATRGSPTSSATSKQVADRLDLRKDFTFGAEVTAIEFDEAANRWTLRTADGHAGDGQVRGHRGRLPVHREQARVPRRGHLRGPVLHTGNWPHEPVDFTGKRVGVIGTGASGIQAIPVIAEQAAHLTVFQRTAQFTIPAENGPLDQDFVALWKKNYPEWRRRARHSAAGFPYPAEHHLRA